eukprot:GGOE01021253.1.p1 GENE.GGOE01021253.1~~GGOE01021253.1.p1  ORF type:complete len:590 (-),score=90.12 GGOE01021253.1:832-2601(-)
MMQGFEPQNSNMGMAAVNDDQAWLVSQIQALRHKLKTDKRELMSMRAKYKSMLDSRGTTSSPDVWSILQQLMTDAKEQAFAIDESIETLRGISERIKDGGLGAAKSASGKADDTVVRCLIFIHKFLHEALQLLEQPSFFGSLGAYKFFEKRLLSTWKHVIGESLPPNWAALLSPLDSATAPKHVLTQTIAAQLAKFLDMCIKQIFVEASKASESEIIERKDEQLAELAAGICSLHQQHTVQMQQRDELIRHMQQEALEAANRQAEWWIARSEEQERDWAEFHRRFMEDYEGHLKVCQKQFAHFSQTKLRAYKEKCCSQMARAEEPQDSPEGPAANNHLGIPPLHLNEHNLKRSSAGSPESAERGQLRATPAGSDADSSRTLQQHPLLSPHSNRTHEGSDVWAPWQPMHLNPLRDGSPQTPARMGSFLAMRHKQGSISSFTISPSAAAKANAEQLVEYQDEGPTPKHRPPDAAVQRPADGLELRKSSDKADHRKLPLASLSSFSSSPSPLGKPSSEAMLEFQGDVLTPKSRPPPDLSVQRPAEGPDGTLSGRRPPDKPEQRKAPTPLAETILRLGAVPVGMSVSAVYHND